jgi:hypothetical protein
MNSGWTSPNPSPWQPCLRRPTAGAFLHPIHFDSRTGAGALRLPPGHEQSPTRPTSRVFSGGTLSTSSDPGWCRNPPGRPHPRIVPAALAHQLGRDPTSSGSALLGSPHRSDGRRTLPRLPPRAHLHPRERCHASHGPRNVRASLGPVGLDDPSPALRAASRHVLVAASANTIFAGSSSILLMSCFPIASVSLKLRSAIARL